MTYCKMAVTILRFFPRRLLKAWAASAVLVLLGEFIQISSSIFDIHLLSEAITHF